jgi:hypothetical protein
MFLTLGEYIELFIASSVYALISSIGLTFLDFYGVFNSYFFLRLAEPRLMFR